MRTDYVIAALELSRFQSQYEETFAELNKDTNK